MLEKREDKCEVKCEWKCEGMKVIFKMRKKIGAKGGAWWLSGKFGAFRPEGRRLESHYSHHVGTLGKSFTSNSQLTVALWRVNSDTVLIL